MKLKKEYKNALMIVGIAVIAVILLVPGLLPSLGALVTGTVNYCDATPFDGKCICRTGEIKKLTGIGVMAYACVPEIVIPSSYSFPMQTWEEALAFAEDEFGTIVCEGEQFYKEGYLTGPLPELYTVPSGRLVILSIDCSIATGPSSGQSAWRLQFDPFDGYVYQRICYPERVMEGMTCPPEIPFTPK